MRALSLPLQIWSEAQVEHEYISCVTIDESLLQIFALCANQVGTIRTRYCEAGERHLHPESMYNSHLRTCLINMKLQFMCVPDAYTRRSYCLKKHSHHPYLLPSNILRRACCLNMDLEISELWTRISAGSQVLAQHLESTCISSRLCTLCRLP